jgi:TIR domain
MASQDRQFDVFLSHSSADKPAVLQIAQRLRLAGLRPWLDAAELVPGADWEPGLARGLKASRTCAFFVGPQQSGDWAEQERQLAQNMAAKQSDFRLIPVLLPGVPEPFNYSALPPFLTLKTWVDFRAGLDDPTAMRRLVAGVQGVPPGLEAAAPADAQTFEPYRGLEVFEADHSACFFGRDAEMQRIIEMMKNSRFVAVLGASGSGKSSLIRAGVVSALRAGALPGSLSWSVLLVRPRATPLSELAAALVKQGAAVSVSACVEAMKRDPMGLYQESLALLRQGDSAVLVVIDQFEEIFTLCNDAAERKACIDNLVHAAAVAEGRVRVLLSMRADFYFKCAGHAELATRMSANQFLLGPLRGDALRAAIERPAALRGYVFEPGLVDTILEDVARQPGALPLLEYALYRLWQVRDIDSHRLTLSAYQSVGGVAGALMQRADDVYESLSPGQQQIARRVLLRLTQPGEGTEDTRRAAPLDELLGGENDADVEETVRRLVEARLLTTSGVPA